MRVGLDATRINQPTGEGRYTREVIRHLIRQFPEVQFYVIIPKSDPLFAAENVEQIIYKEVDGIQARILYAFKIGAITRQNRLDVFHNITNYAAFWTSCPVITNVMDLVTLKYPKVRGNFLHSLIYQYIFPSLLKRSRFLVAISENTARDIKACYGFDTHVKTIYCGIDREQFNTVSVLDPNILNRFGLPPNYLLFVGYLSLKKNLEVVLRSMQRLNSQGMRTHLALVGKRGYGSESFFSLVKELGLDSQVTETGFVTNEELTMLYRHAGAFVFPSIYEGFGLPVVEAMACGAPVLVSDAGPMPELVDDRRCLCNPHDIEGWAKGIRRALTDADFRIWARAHGLQQANLFSWERCASALHELYLKAVEC